MRFLYARTGGAPARPRRAPTASFVAIALVGAALLGPSAHARADAAPTDAAQTEEASAPAALSASAETALSSAYQQAIDRAVDEHERGHYEEAREHFRTAHEAFPNARTLRGLGKVEFELRNYGESVKLLTAALASTVRPLSPELREEVQNILDRAGAYVGEVHVDVQPGSASVSVDGVTIGSGPQTALALLVGEHVLEFRASGRLPERRLISIRGREQITIQVVLAPPPLQAKDAPPLSGERAPGGTPIYKRWWLWTAVGVVAAGSATALALSLHDREAKTRAPAVTPGAWVAENP